MEDLGGIFPNRERAPGKDRSLSHTHTSITCHTVTQEPQCIQASPPLPSTSGGRGTLAGAGLQAWSLASGRSPSGGGLSPSPERRAGLGRHCLEVTEQQQQQAWGSGESSKRGRAADAEEGPGLLRRGGTQPGPSAARARCTGEGAEGERVGRQAGRGEQSQRAVAPHWVHAESTPPPCCFWLLFPFDR